MSCRSVGAGDVVDVPILRPDFPALEQRAASAARVVARCPGSPLTGRAPSQEQFDALYDDVIDVATWARENGYQLAYDWIMDSFAQHQNDEQALPSVTASQTDKQSHASSMASTAHRQETP